MNISPSLVLLPIYSLFVFPFVTEYYINFEQAIYPVSYTMAAIGFFLIIVCRPNLAGFLAYPGPAVYLATAIHRHSLLLAY
jgi:hypothetical protein